MKEVRLIPIPKPEELVKQPLPTFPSKTVRLIHTEEPPRDVYLPTIPLTKVEKPPIPRIPLMRLPLEMGGQTLGAIGGAAIGGIPGTVLGGGLGYAAGEEAATGLEEVTGWRKPSPLGEKIRKFPEKVAIGMGYEVTGQIVAKGIKALLPAIFKYGKETIIPEVKKAGETLKRFTGGKGFTPAQLTTSAWLDTAESVAEGSLTGRARVQAYKESLKKGYNELVQRIYRL